MKLYFEQIKWYPDEEQYHVGNLGLLNALDSLTFLCFTSMPVRYDVTIIAPQDHTETRRHGVYITYSCPFKALDDGSRDTAKSFSEIQLDYMN